MWEGEQSLYFAFVTDFQLLFLSILFPKFLAKVWIFCQIPFALLFKMLTWSLSGCIGQALWNPWILGSQVNK